MKKITLILALFVAAISFTSCNPEEEESMTWKSFVGTWAVTKVEHYNIDFYGNPIESTVEVVNFPIDDPQGGIDMIFRNDKSGEIRNRDIDTIFNEIGHNVYDTILCPDTTIVSRFTYTYDDETTLLYLNMDSYYTYNMIIENFDDRSFIYVDEYKQNYVEKTYLKRMH